MRQLKETLQLPSVSAEAWCVYDVDSGGKLLKG